MPLIVSRFATAAAAAAAAAGRGWRLKEPRTGAATTPCYAHKMVASLFMVHSCLLLVALFMSVAVYAARVQCQAQRTRKKSEKNKYAHMRMTRRGRTRAGAKGFGSLLNCVAPHLLRAYMTQLSSRTTTAATTREAHASSASVMFIKSNLYLHFKQYAN